MSGPKLEIVEATETSITVSFDPVPGVTTHTLEWKEYPAPWSACRSKSVTGGSGKTKTEIAPLQPGTTYCVRMSAGGGSPGPEVILDTEQVGCTPKQKKGCVIL